MTTGAHVVIDSPGAEADPGLLRDVRRPAHVDAGNRWLLFEDGQLDLYQSRHPIASDL